MLERLVTGNELDPSIVLAMLVREGWRTWPDTEQEAIHGYLMAVWRLLLAEYPPEVGSFGDAAEFLNVTGDLAGSTGPFLHAWDAIHFPAADRHLADLVIEWVGGAQLPDAAFTWMRRSKVRDRLYAAFERDHDASWADGLARAYDFLTWQVRPDQ